ncbi:hypothetical protein FJY63_10905, partial [Candidatus Sumerlaeota bacterium]|nr:hypothetical protein [Candidatus Sumerlaeota bacterium]
ADIHPLAVIIAKTNYVLALGDLLKKRKRAITIPVYLSDTLRLPERFIEGPHYEIRIDSETIYVPDTLLQNADLYDHAVELAKEFARQNKGKEKQIALEAFQNFLVVQRSAAAEDASLVQALFAIAEALKRLMDQPRDTIWAFVLKNIYKPLFFKRKFDFVVGNPPWIAFRFTEPAYQAFLKRQITEEYKLLTGRGELITHIEVATLFLVRAADLYLKSSGTIAFVLPRSLFSADQHDGLRRHAFKLAEQEGHGLLWRELWDCENVDPLFNVPSCVLIAGKTPHGGPPPEAGEGGGGAIPGQILSGTLQRKNAALADAATSLTVENVQFSLHQRGKRSFWDTEKGVAAHPASPYKAKFAQGATIVPRSFWFVQVKRSPIGFNPEVPLLETDPRAIERAKAPYQNLRLEDNIERCFLYATLLSTDLLPFGHLDYRLVVLPIEPEENHYKLVEANEVRDRGFYGLARWLEKAESEWTSRRGEKAGRMSIYERLDRVHGLTHQSSLAKYRVIYPLAATYLCAAALRSRSVTFQIEGQTIIAEGLLIDHALYCFETNSRNEAHFLTAVLNALEIDKRIKPMQARGLWGPHDIHKKVLELPIPLFDAANPTHRRLSESGKECSAKVEHWLARGGAGNIKSIGKLRSMVRRMLSENLAEIDELVKRILAGQ